MDFSKLSREDLMVGGGGLVLLIGLLAFPWFSTSPLGGSRRPRRHRRARYAIWGIAGADRDDPRRRRPRRWPASAPPTQIPTTQFGREMTRAAACGADRSLFLFISSSPHVGDFGWGFFVDLILAIVVVGRRMVERAGQVDAVSTARVRRHRRRAPRATRGAAAAASLRGRAELQARLPDPRRRPRPHHRAARAAARARREARRRRRSRCSKAPTRRRQRRPRC